MHDPKEPKAAEATSLSPRPSTDFSPDRCQNLTSGPPCKYIRLVPMSFQGYIRASSSTLSSLSHHCVSCRYPDEAMTPENYMNVGCSILVYGFDARSGVLCSGSSFVRVSFGWPRAGSRIPQQVLTLYASRLPVVLRRCWWLHSQTALGENLHLDRESIQRFRVVSSCKA